MNLFTKQKQTHKTAATHRHRLRYRKQKGGGEEG